MAKSANKIVRVRCTIAKNWRNIGPVIDKEQIAISTMKTAEVDVYYILCDETHT